MPQRVSEHRIPSTASDPDNYLRMPIRWSFRKIDYDHEQWGFNAQTQSLQRAFKYLSGLEQMENWEQILHDGGGRGRKNTRHHPRNCGELCREAQKRIIELNYLTDTMFSISCGGLFRIWGIRSGEKFEVVWVDPKHEVSPINTNNK